jgi:hypothetical protein
MKGDEAEVEVEVEIEAETEIETENVELLKNVETVIVLDS